MFRKSCLALRVPATGLSVRPFATTRLACSEPLKHHELKEDVSVTKQYDNETPVSEQIKEFYELADNTRISMLGTVRSGNIVTRAMAVSKREGPDFLYLANIHSQKMRDIEQDDKVNVTFFDASSMSWISVSGKATISQDETKIREIYSPIVLAWFGSESEGPYTGAADDPRMAIVKVKATRVSYYKSTKGKIGRMTDIAKAIGLGQVAQTGVLREIHSEALEGARSG
ncbi:hypothetical protein BCR37DRAFT_294362 [Protomyces lactucae-debilis]|uniref:General stress protein FMN-binding split barrel domain-containing protein n=1 Tax=Protomyces lactucae-debilis TaxID=2754530 RepID=A0A1Y2FGT3_PROLT|nr:uncharacterized protein BCR37DRAFT_294362 [Protomyces lactucae-debilis]ORY83133.1 hypothetical protein BCR37DRAFT_294362 [Protomyces lactucae-debilis]